MTNKSIHLPTLLVLSILSMNCVGDMVIDDFTAETNDRFKNSSSYLLYSYDMSGSVISDNDRWATLISPNVVIGANHWGPIPGTVLDFFPDNNPSSPQSQRTVVSGERLGTSDLYISVLDSPLPSSFQTYSFATESIVTATDFVLSDYYLETVYMQGRSSTKYNSNSDTTNIATGKNILDRWYSSINIGGTIDAAIAAVQDSSGDPNYTTYEAFAQLGDSGGPAFVEDNGELKLIGINWAGGDVLGENVSIFSYVGNYALQIQAFIDANPIPEPTSLVIFACITTLALMRRNIPGDRICVL